MQLYNTIILTVSCFCQLYGQISFVLLATPSAEDCYTRPNTVPGTLSNTIKVENGKFNVHAVKTDEYR